MRAPSLFYDFDETFKSNHDTQDTPVELDVTMTTLVDAVRRFSTSNHSCSFNHLRIAQVLGTL
jgi:hypothetical protein